MGKFMRSWKLFGCAASVIGRNKRLLLFPIVSFFLVIPIAIFCLGLPIAWPSGHAFLSGPHWLRVAERFGASAATFARAEAHHGESAGAAGEQGHNEAGRPVPVAGVYGYMAGVYLLSMFLATFLNVAFYSEILNALKGGGVSIGRGLRFAASRWKAILCWSLLAGLVGILIRAIEERLGFIGAWIAKLVGFAWSVATVFAVPVLITESETANPVVFVKTSARLLARTWGEALVGFLGLQIGTGLILVVSLLWLGAAAVVSVMLKSVLLIGVAFGVWLLVIIVLAYVVGVAQKVYVGALFLYAAEGTILAPFDRETLNMAWKVKGATMGNVRTPGQPS